MLFGSPSKQVANAHAQYEELPVNAMPCVSPDTPHRFRWIRSAMCAVTALVLWAISLQAQAQLACDLMRGF